MKAVLSVLAVLVTVHILMLSTIRIYPMNDLPCHLAVSTIHRHYGGPSDHFAEYYNIDLFPGPNCLHPLFCGLRIFPDVEAGNRVYFALYLALLPLSLLLIARRVGRNAWLALLALLLLYNMSFRWGFAGYTMAIPLTMLTLYIYLVSLESRRARDKAIVAVALSGLFFTHAMAGLYCALLIVMSVVIHNRRSFRAGLREMLPVVPFAALVLWWAISSPAGRGNMLGEVLEYYCSEYLRSLAGRSGILFNDHRHLFGGQLGRTVGTLFSLCIVGPLVAGLLVRAKSFRKSLRRPEVKSVFFFLLVTLACYLLLPARAGGVYFINRRLSVFVLIWSVVLLASIFPRSLSRPWVAALCVLCVAHAALWGSYFQAFERENELFVREFLPRESSGKTLISLVHNRNFRGAPVYSNFGDYHVVWNLGITKGLFAQYKFFGVSPRKPEEWPRPKWRGKPNTRERLGPYSTSDFILTRGVSGPWASVYLRGFRQKRSAGKWVLYEKDSDAGPGPTSPRTE
ncbi:MAG: hypothetical protein PVF95_03155 [bacterium]|jgi:hypothetical protein